MPIARGQISPAIPSTAILQYWKNRYGNENAPQADLETDGSSFTIEYSRNWDINSLKHSFELEVHRVAMASDVLWAELGL
jgi:hypothetical protein